MTSRTPQLTPAMTAVASEPCPAKRQLQAVPLRAGPRPDRPATRARPGPLPWSAPRRVGSARAGVMARITVAASSWQAQNSTGSCSALPPHAAVTATSSCCETIPRTVFDVRLSTTTEPILLRGMASTTCASGAVSGTDSTCFPLRFTMLAILMLGTPLGAPQWNSMKTGQRLLSRPRAGQRPLRSSSATALSLVGLPRPISRPPL